MLAQTDRPLPLRRVLDDGLYLLANVGGVAAPETQRLLGALLINGIFHAAKSRDSHRRRSYFLIVDEFGDFATRDFANSLDQLRKFGCHLVLSHQRLRQLEREDPDVASAVATNTRIKVVFGGLERFEAERMTKELFTGQIRGDHVKNVVRQTKFRPVFETFEVLSESESDSESTSASRLSGKGRSRSASEQSSKSDWHQESGVEPFGHRTLRSIGHGSSEVNSDSESEVTSHGASTGRSWSRSIVPITRHEEFTEETGRQYSTLEEEWEKRIASVHKLPNREAYLKVYNSPPIRIRTPDINVERLTPALAEFERRILQVSPYARSTELVEREIEDRRTRVLELARNTEENGRPFDVRSFRE